MGHEVELVTSDNSGLRGKWTTSFEQGVQIHRYTVPYSQHMGFWERTKAFIIFFLHASFRSVRSDADIIFATSTPLTVAIPGVLASRIKKVPLVFEVRDLWPQIPIALGLIKHPFLKFLTRSLEKWAYRHSSAVIALSPQMKEGIVSAGYPRQNVAVIPNACDFDLFAHNEEGVEKFFILRPYLLGRPIILYPGSFGISNGLEFAVDLAHELQQIGSDVATLLVGDGPTKEKIRQQAQLLGVLDVNLFIEDAVPKTEVATMFSAATCIATFVGPHPDLAGNSANKFFDSLAAAKPVVLNFDGWMTELVRNRSFGLDLSGLRIKDAAAQVDSKLHDKSWLAKASRHSFQVGMEFFARDNLINQLEQILQLVHQDSDSFAEQIAPGNYQKEIPASD